MKKLILAGFIALGTWGVIAAVPTPAAANHVDCSVVRCAACPEGWVPSPTPHNCCRCVPE